MNLEMLRDYCLSKKATTEDFPFDEKTLCFRVGGKIYALTDVETVPTRVNLKCDPELAIELRERYDYVLPGWHMNKKHWNTVVADENAEFSFYTDLVDKSYDLIFKSLKKADREKIENM